MNRPVRVLVVDDHPLFRSGMRALLGAAPETEIVGEASSGEEALHLSATLRPDVILMDLQMPGLSGIDATRRILQGAPETRILVITMFEDDHSIFGAIRAGARGYVLKGAHPDEVLRAILGAANGEAIFSPAVAGRLTEFFGDHRLQEVATPFPELTDRERQVLDLLAQGQSNAEIAKSLALSTKTVANHVSNILGKLHLTDRTQALLQARAAGLGHGQP